MGLIKSKKTYATCWMTQVCCSQSSCLHSRPLLTQAPAGDTQTFKSRSGSVSVGSLGTGVHKVLFEPSKHLWKVWSLILNTISRLLLSYWVISFALGHGGSFLVGSNILLSVVQQRVATLKFSQETMNACPSIPPS